jgi:hypothetical protein
MNDGLQNSKCLAAICYVWPAWVSPQLGRTAASECHETVTKGLDIGNRRVYNERNGPYQVCCN